MSKSRKLKKTNKPIMIIALLALVVCIVFVVKKRFFDNEKLNEENVNKNIFEESSISEVIDTSVDKNDNLTIDIGDVITFGSYPQSDASGNTKEPIEWIVLDKKDGAKLLLSKYIIDCKPYNNDYVNITWADCSLRTWLNGEFLNTAFDMDEYSKIQKTALTNDDNADNNTDGGSDTDDRVFCLSIEEALKYFGHGNKDALGYDVGKSISTTGTNFAKAVDNNGTTLLVNDNNNAWYFGFIGYWLRSPGEKNIAAANVGSDGYLTTVGANVTFGEIGVRPAIWVYENYSEPNDTILTE